MFAPRSLGATLTGQVSAVRAYLSTRASDVPQPEMPRRRTPLPPPELAQ